MAAVIEAPLEMIEDIADLRFPPKTDQLLQSLMDRNTNGELNAQEREELEGLVELSQAIAMVRAKAIQVLGRKPT